MDLKCILKICGKQMMGPTHITDWEIHVPHSTKIYTRWNSDVVSKFRS